VLFRSTTRVQDNMVVRTDSERLQTIRRGIVELYLSEQPEGLDPSHPLGILARGLGLSKVRYASPQRRAPVKDESNPFFAFDNALCISCARCVRACDEVQGTFALTMDGRGFQSRPLPGSGTWSGSNCVSCGACVKECPTGALREKSVIAHGAPISTVRTTCAYCGVGCAFDAGVRDGRVVTMSPADDGPANHGHACMKGRFGWTYVSEPDRLRSPLLRNGHHWQEISWPAALDRIAEQFSRLTRMCGADSVATISSSRGTNEDNYLFAKFMRCVIGTNHIDNCARVCHSATVTGMMETLGASAATNSIDDLDHAKLIMVVGANPTESHPVVGARIKQAVRRGIPLIVIDPRRTELARLATLHLRLKPGTNVALLNAMGHVIVRDALLDKNFIVARTEGVEDWLQAIQSVTPESAEEVTGVAAEMIREAARRYAEIGRAHV